MESLEERHVLRGDCSWEGWFKEREQAREDGRSIDYIVHEARVLENTQRY